MNACQKISVFDTNNARATKYRLRDCVMVDPHYPISVKTLYVYIPKFIMRSYNHV